MKHIDDTSNELPSWLTDLKQKGDGLNLPDGYFESLEQRILEKTGTQERIQQREGLKATLVNRNGLFRWSRPLAAAAALAAILVMAWWFVRPEASPSHELTGEDLQAYILENAREFELEQLASVLPEHTAAPQQEATESPNASGNDDHKLPEELHPEDIEHLLDDLSDEELQEIL